MLHIVAQHFLLVVKRSHFFKKTWSEIRIRNVLPVFNHFGVVIHIYIPYDNQAFRIIMNIALWDGNLLVKDVWGRNFKVQNKIVAWIRVHYVWTLTHLMKTGYFHSCHFFDFLLIQIIRFPLFIPKNHHPHSISLRRNYYLFGVTNRLYINSDFKWHTAESLFSKIFF